jgi:hypothetical protein
LSEQPDLNLAVIGNCQIAALIDTAGTIVWARLPRLDADPVFTLEGTRQICLRNTAVVETIHEGHEATVRVTDFGPRFRLSRSWEDVV